MKEGVCGSAVVEWIYILPLHCCSDGEKRRVGSGTTEIYHKGEIFCSETVEVRVAVMVRWW